MKWVKVDDVKLIRFTDNAGQWMKKNGTAYWIAWSQIESKDKTKDVVKSIWVTPFAASKLHLEDK